MELFKCSVCNYVHEGELDGKPCPKCGQPSTVFKKLSDEEAEKIYNSDETNDLLMELSKLAMEMAIVASEGIELNLDPNCVKTFEYANDKAWEIKQMAKAEIENHIAKGKW